MKRIYLIPLLGMALCCHSAGAEDRLQLDKTTILGTGELPKVTFVVPWRDAPSAIPEWKPSPAAHPRATPLDHDVYQRQLEYLKQLRQNKRDGSPH
jgi:hypothetical protein